MKRWIAYLKEADQRRALRNLRLDPHLAKDVGLPPMKSDYRITKTLW